MDRNHDHPRQQLHPSDSVDSEDDLQDKLHDDEAQDWSWIHDIPSPKRQDGREHEEQSRRASTLDNMPYTLHKMDEIVAPSNEALRDIRSLGHYVTEAHSKLARVRKETMLLREEGVFEREQCFHQRTFFKESQKALADRMARLDVAVPLPLTSEPDIRRLQQRLIDDKDSVEAQDRKVLHIEDELLQKDYYLQQKEATFAQAVEMLLAALRKQQVVPSSEESLPPPRGSPIHHPEASPPPSPVVPVSLETYHEKVGALGWKKERLVELRIEYQESRAARILRRDHEESLETSDEEFEDEYRRKLSFAQQDLATASAEVEDAEAVCVAEGLIPDRHNKQHVQDVPEISLFPSGPDFAFLPNSAAPELKSILSERVPSSTLLTTTTGPLNLDAAPKRVGKQGARRSRNRVRNWMQSNERTDEYPFDEEYFQEYPEWRPISPTRRSINGTLEDMSDWPEVGNDIKENLPEQLKQHSQSEPNIFHRKGAREQLRPPRSSSESRVEELRRRKDSQQNGDIYVDFPTAKISGIG